MSKASLTQPFSQVINKHERSPYKDQKKTVTDEYYDEEYDEETLKTITSKKELRKKTIPFSEDNTIDIDDPKNNIQPVVKAKPTIVEPRFSEPRVSVKSGLDI